MARLSLSVGLLPFTIMFACTVTPRGALEANLNTAKSRASTGASLYAEQCASCHGQRGEGITAPALMGLDALPTFPRDASQSSMASNTDPNELQMRQQLNPGGMPSRQPFYTAQDVFQYVSTKMPPKRAGTLGADQVFGVVNYMLLAHGTAVPPEGVNPTNASKVVVNPR